MFWSDEMKHFTLREHFSHKEDAQRLAEIIRDHGLKARIVGERGSWNVYEGLKFARLKGYNEESQKRIRRI